jgi:type IV secretory pathway VirJ component
MMSRAILYFTLTIVSTTALFASAEDTLHFGRFGKVILYRETQHPEQVVLFVSGDGGWNLGVIDMARALSSLNALVIGIDINYYLKELEKSTEKCSYPAADFEMLSKYVQKKLNYEEYVIPVLVGYSSGATLVYAILVQAPATTFQGAISLGFCPDLPLIKPLCRGNGLEWETGPKGKGYNFLPAPNLQPEWMVLQGDIDQVCSLSQAKSFVKQVKGAKIIPLPKVGHGFSVQKNWLPQFNEAFLKLTSIASANPPALEEGTLKSLPLIEISADNSQNKLMAVHITGDGGWGVTDKGIGEGLVKSGIPVVGLNSLKYFWTRRTPDETAGDLQKIILHYLKKWNKEELVMIGYSFGADVMPFLINRLDPAVRAKVKLLVLLGASHQAAFEFHLTDWIGGSHSNDELAVRPEIEKLKDIKILCFYGQDDQDVLCPELSPELVTAISLKGGHRIGGDFDPIVQQILRVTATL